MANTPLICPKHVIDHLCRLYPDYRVWPMETLTEEFSGSDNTPGACQSVERRGFDGLAFAKIDPDERTREEYRRHLLALTEATKSFIPSVSSAPLEPVDG